MGRLQWKEKIDKRLQSLEKPAIVAWLYPSGHRRIPPLGLWITFGLNTDDVEHLDGVPLIVRPDDPDYEKKAALLIGLREHPGEQMRLRSIKYYYRDPNAQSYFGMGGTGYRMIDKGTYLSVIVANDTTMPHEAAEEFLTSYFSRSQEGLVLEPSITMHLTQYAHDELQTVPAFRVSPTKTAKPVVPPDPKNPRELRRLEDRLVGEFIKHPHSYRSYLRREKAEEDNDIMTQAEYWGGPRPEGDYREDPEELVGFRLSKVFEEEFGMVSWELEHELGKDGYWKLLDRVAERLKGAVQRRGTIVRPGGQLEVSFVDAVDFNFRAPGIPRDVSEWGHEDHWLEVDMDDGQINIQQAPTELPTDVGKIYPFVTLEPGVPYMLHPDVEITVTSGKGTQPTTLRVRRLKAGDGQTLHVRWTQLRYGFKPPVAGPDVALLAAGASERPKPPIAPGESSVNLVQAGTNFAHYFVHRFPQVDPVAAAPQTPRYILGGSLATMLWAQDETLTPNEREALQTCVRQIHDVDIVQLEPHEPLNIPEKLDISDLPAGARTILDFDPTKQLLICDLRPSFGFKDFMPVKIGGEIYFIARPDFQFAYKMLAMLKASLRNEQTSVAKHTQDLEILQRAFRAQSRVSQNELLTTVAKIIETYGSSIPMDLSPVLEALRQSTEIPELRELLTDLSSSLSWVSAPAAPVYFASMLWERLFEPILAVAVVLRSGETLQSAISTSTFFDEVIRHGYASIASLLPTLDVAEKEKIYQEIVCESLAVFFANARAGTLDQIDQAARQAREHGQAILLCLLRAA